MQKLQITVFSRAFLLADGVACEDARRAAYSQLCLHFSDEYNRQQAGIGCQNHRNVAHALAKVRNFERVASKT